MAKIEFKQEGVGHFIADNFLRVPVYQRPFAWEKSHVQDLFEELNYLNRREPYIQEKVKITTSETVQGQRIDIAYGIVYKLRDALKLAKSK